MEQAPEQKCDVRAMPYAGAGKDNKFVDTGSGPSFPAAAQRYVQVFPEPAG